MLFSAFGGRLLPDKGRRKTERQYTVSLPKVVVINIKYIKWSDRIWHGWKKVPVAYQSVLFLEFPPGKRKFTVALSRILSGKCIRKNNEWLLQKDYNIHHITCTYHWVKGIGSDLWHAEGIMDYAGENSGRMKKSCNSLLGKHLCRLPVIWYFSAENVLFTFEFTVIIHDIFEITEQYPKEKDSIKLFVRVARK